MFRGQGDEEKAQQGKLRQASVAAWKPNEKGITKRSCQVHQILLIDQVRSRPRINQWISNMALLMR